MIDGVELADSWATDAHKWLNVPYDCGVALVKSREDHRAAMTTAAAYLDPDRRASSATPSIGCRTSRAARAACRSTRTCARWAATASRNWSMACARGPGRWPRALAKEAGVAILADVVLNQVLVRFGDDDELTRRVVTGVQQEGTCWLSGTNWQGKAAMRISVSNWATSEDDAARSVAAILGVWRQVRG